MRFFVSFSTLLLVFALFAQDTIYYKTYTSRVYSDDVPVIYEVGKTKNGALQRFFIENNQLAMQGQYRNNRAFGEITKYYPNGQIFEESYEYDQNQLDTISRWYSNGRKIGDFLSLNSKDKSKSGQTERVISFYDSLGNQTVVNGLGYASYYDLETESSGSGDVRDGLKDGIWKGSLKESNYEEEYRNGKFVEGRSWNEYEEQTYDRVYEGARFPTGMQSFYGFLKSNLKYPRTASDAGIQGRVFVSFVVEKDGSLTNLQILKGIGGGCDEEALRIMKLNPKWRPMKKRGIAEKQRMILPILFRNSG